MASPICGWRGSPGLAKKKKPVPSVLDWHSGFHVVPFIAHFLHAQIMENCTTGSVLSF